MAMQGTTATAAILKSQSRPGSVTVLLMAKLTGKMSSVVAECWKEPMLEGFEGFTPIEPETWEVGIDQPSILKVIGTHHST